MYDELVKELRDSAEWADRLALLMGRAEGDAHAPVMRKAADAIEELQKCLDGVEADNDSLCETIAELSEIREEQKAQIITVAAENMPRWIPVTERLPECDLGAEVGNIEWISCGIVHAGCFGRGGKYRDAYFRTWTDAGEGMDAKDADYWRAVTIPEPPKEE